MEARRRIEARRPRAETRRTKGEQRPTRDQPPAVDSRTRTILWFRITKGERRRQGEKSGGRGGGRKRGSRPSLKGGHQRGRPPSGNERKPAHRRDSQPRLGIGHGRNQAERGVGGPAALASLSSREATPERPAPSAPRERRDLAAWGVVALVARTAGGRMQTETDRGGTGSGPGSDRPLQMRGRPR